MAAGIEYIAKLKQLESTSENYKENKQRIQGVTTVDEIARTKEIVRSSKNVTYALVTKLSFRQCVCCPKISSVGTSERSEANAFVKMRFSPCKTQK